MVNEHCVGMIKDITPRGEAIIIAPLPNLENAFYRQYSEVEVIYQDSRRITSEQRRKIYALIGEITEFVAGIKDAGTIEDTKESLKWDFVLERMESQERRLFSLSDCDMTTASAFISYLIDFIIKNDIPTMISLRDQCEDIGKYVYSCLANKKCAVCGQDGELHHCEGSRIGIGSDRQEVSHLGRRAICLCRKHHAECHNDEAKFLDKWHLSAIPLDERLCKIYQLNR